MLIVQCELTLQVILYFSFLFYTVGGFFERFLFFFGPNLNKSKVDSHPKISWTVLALKFWMCNLLFAIWPFVILRDYFLDNLLWKNINPTFLLLFLFFFDQSGTDGASINKTVTPNRRIHPDRNDLASFLYDARQCHNNSIPQYHFAISPPPSLHFITDKLRQHRRVHLDCQTRNMWGGI